MLLTCVELSLPAIKIKAENGGKVRSKKEEATKRLKEELGIKKRGR
jgi:hypothetical protein